jgi:hypothetical protein
MKKKIIVSVIIIIVIFIGWYLFPKHYSETLQGVYYQLGDTEISENLTIHLDGKLQNYITGKKSFEGTIDFETDGIQIVPEDRTNLQLIINLGEQGTIFSNHRNGKETILDLYMVGAVYASEDFSEITIMVNSIDSKGNSGSWSGSDGYIISVPADTREEALNISEELIPHVKRQGNSFIYDNDAE